ncbi:amidohydrolase family protein [Phenylobacterium sp.]|uniref:amidohydrolase family protein n=1 Tax=Phenylobacterium sp. TaxID=1871053 RepID=UPI0025E43F06|nr:amidohydrolase family protein [Phenylobacterium sp.]MCA6325661.1 amidohydrolase family protein [Phenylobacterium sp.]
MDKPSATEAAPEAILDPDRRILDPHHHLWPAGAGPAYLLEDLRGDTGDGHRVEATVFVECMTGYLTEGSEALRRAGETAFVARVARESRDGKGARIAAIVGSADLLAPDDLDALLDAHVEAGEGLFRGIRHAAAWDASDAIRPSHHHPPPHLYLDATFRRGFAKLAARGLTFDAWLFHPQIPELTDLARAFPGARIILDHLGGPLGIGPYAGKRDEYFPRWRADMAGLATCPNVAVKLGGMAMPINGWDWHKTGAPDSAAFAAAQGDWYRAAIDLFGPDRCMFESNFPVDRASLSYRTLWNGLKRIAAPYSEAEKDQMFSGTAARVYGIEL